MLQSTYHVVVGFDGSINYVVTSLNKVKVYTEPSIETLIKSTARNPMKDTLKHIVGKKKEILIIVKSKFGKILEQKSGCGCTRVQINMKPEPFFVNVIVGDGDYYDCENFEEVSLIDSIDEYSLA